MSTKKTMYQRILRAAEKGTGVRLTAAEAFELAEDDAIFATAMGDDEEDERIRKLRSSRGTTT